MTGQVKIQPLQPLPWDESRVLNEPFEPRQSRRLHMFFFVLLWDFFLCLSNQTVYCFAFTSCLSNSELHAIESLPSTTGSQVHNNSQMGHFFLLILPEVFPRGGGAWFAGGWSRLAGAPVPRQLVSSSIRSQLALQLLFGGF